MLLSLLSQALEALPRHFTRLFKLFLKRTNRCAMSLLRFRRGLLKLVCKFPLHFGRLRTHRFAHLGHRSLLCHCCRASVTFARFLESLNFRGVRHLRAVDGEREAASLCDEAVVLLMQLRPDIFRSIHRGIKLSLLRLELQRVALLDVHDRCSICIAHLLQLGIELQSSCGAF